MADISNSLGSLAKSASLITLGTFLGRGLGLIAETFIARSLQPTLYGDVALAYTIISALASLVLLGIHEGTTRLGSASQDVEAQYDFAVAGFLSVGVSGCLGILVVVQFSEQISHLVDKPQLAQYLILLAPYLILFPLSKVVISGFRVQERSAALVFTRAGLARVVGLCALFFISVSGVSAIIGPVYWISVPATTVFVGGVLVFRRFNKRLFSIPPRSRVIELWSFSLPLAASSIVFLFLSQLDVLMIGFLLDSKDVGYYRAIQPLKQGATIFIGAFSFLFLPLATKAYQQENFGHLDTLFSAVTKWAVILTFPITSLMLFIPGDLVEFLFGRAYAESALPLAILSGGLFFRAISGPNGDLVKAINMPIIEAQASLVGVVSNFVLNLILIPKFGIAGAAVATVVGYCVYNLIELVIIYREVGVTPISTGVWKPIIISSIVLWSFSSMFSFEGILRIAFFGTLSTLIILISVIVTQSVEQPDMILITRIESITGELPSIRRMMEWSMED